PLRDGADADAARPLLAPDPRLLVAAQVREAARPQGERQDNRAPLPPLQALRRARVLALRHTGLGSGARGHQVTPSGVMEPTGLEPVTSCMPCTRSPS